MVLTTGAMTACTILYRRVSKGPEIILGTSLMLIYDPKDLLYDFIFVHICCVQLGRVRRLEQWGLGPLGISGISGLHLPLERRLSRVNSLFNQLSSSPAGSLSDRGCQEYLHICVRAHHRCLLYTSPIPRD